MTPGILSRLAMTVIAIGISSAPGIAGAREDSPGGGIAGLGAPFPMAAPPLPAIPPRTFDIRTFGAREGAPATEPIRSALRAAEGAGGGAVVIPAGKWMTGALRLPDNTELRVSRDAVLLFSQDPHDYLPVVPARHEEIECYKYSSFIYAEGRKNIAITGEGVLDGAGGPWWRMKQEGRDAEKLLYDMGARGVPPSERVFDGRNGRALRPAFFQPLRCENVLVEGVTFRYGPMWTIAPTYCRSVTIRNVTVVTRGEGGTVPNGDGVDLSSTRDVLIERCTFETGDDCIAIKAGRGRDGLRVGLPSENIVIRHCAFGSGHGGVVLGSETAGGIRNVYAHDCTFRGTDRMVRIKSARGRGGAMENLWFRNLTGEGILNEALLITMLYEGTRLPAGRVSASTPRLRNVHFTNVACSSGRGYAVELLGLPEMPLEEVTFDSLTMRTARGIHCVDARDIRFRSVRLTPGEPPETDLSHSEGVTFNGTLISPPLAGVPGAGIDSAADWSVRIAESFLLRHPGGATYDSAFPSARWSYEQGLMLGALWRMFLRTGDRRYENFVRENIDRYVTEEGEITTYRFDEFQLDNIAPGPALLDLYGSTHDERYRSAARILRSQLREQPRTGEGGFWHKRIYPFQMWLDGMFMAEPFYARYGAESGEGSDIDDVLLQFRLMAAHCRDPKTGLWHHGWDEKRRERWADSVTGCSPTFWGRSMGWLMMALVEVLQWLPKDHPGARELAGMLRDLSAALLAVRDPLTALWYQVPDQPGRAGNYTEASASAMFAYAFARGAHLGLLDPKYLEEARKTFDGITRHLVSVNPAGEIDLHHICSGAGLGGGPPYRDGSFAYYVGVPQETNDIKGYAPFLLAAIELREVMRK